MSWTERNRPLRTVLIRVGVVVAVLVLTPYVWGPIYRFPDPNPFRGSELWNPYESASGSWLRANLHAHGKAWVGLTNGQQADEEVARRYSNLGYDLPGVSDYQKIAARRGVGTFPLYEHGYNIQKSHQIAIGAHSVEWFDFPLWQGLSNHQYVIDRVKRKAELVALAHPSSRDAYSGDILQYLTGYDLVEIVNGPFVVEDVWDTALSSGHPVWAVANDDTHDVTDPKRTAAGWNMIDAPTTGTADIVAALRAGRSYAVLRTGAIDAAQLTVVDRVNVQDRTVSVSVSGAPSKFTFVGQDGAVRKTVKETTRADYTFNDADTYVRTVIESPQTILYLNPVVRYDGRLPVPAAKVDVASTWLLRGSSLIGGVLLLWAYSRRRRPVSRPVTQPALVDAKRTIA